MTDNNSNNVNNDNNDKNNIVSEKDTIQEMAELIIEITSPFRGTSEDNSQMCWQHDAIFFNRSCFKINNL